MNKGIKNRLFYYFLTIIVVSLAICGLIIEEIVESVRMDLIRSDLLRHLQSMEWMVQALPAPVAPATYQEMAGQLGTIMAMRVTFIDGDGWVVGDSSVAADQLQTIENHHKRPEVAEALLHGVGSAIRTSTTVNTDLYYLAYAIDRGGQRMIIRLARSLHDLQEEIASLRRLVIYSVLFATLLAALLSRLAARLFTRPLRALVKQAKSIAGQQSNSRLVTDSQDEVGGLASSFNLLLNQLEEVMASVSLERDRLKIILEGILDGVIAVDLRGQIILVNHAVMEIFALSSSPVSRNLSELIPEEQLLGLLPPSQGAVCRREIVLAGRDMRQILLTSSCTANGQGCILLLRDITEKNRLQQVQREFIASASHELRTPISIIRLNAETLMDGNNEPEEVNFLVEAIYRQSLRMSQLIAHLLDLSRLESGSYPLRCQEFFLLPLSKQVSESLHHWMESREIVLSNQIGADVTLFADPSAVEQVLLNLVANAIRYTPMRSQIILRSRPHPDHDKSMIIAVEDNGEGIAEEHHRQLFNRFYRVDPGRSREMGGSGLGLAIVRQLVEAMGGEVGLSAVQPSGCCFWFTLPVCPA
ncbi:HAMP domain-containing sensor histidine kinase [Candidatus Magnetaquicoccus inordinatus]|uniref:HAMP domain-containing sensor histidine kinase n=1 Tax=Candidatus Magnetaquicoccus inordinatus TaxID=2496818 RepID=UPI00187D16FF|nr:ATP-binding protein [Candidatus Magnetaquicoccus inordinatus]